MCYLNASLNYSKLWRHTDTNGLFLDRIPIDFFIPPVNVTIWKNERYDMKVVIEGNQSELWINAEKQDEHTLDDSNPIYAAGNIGVFSWLTRASYDDVRVSGADSFVSCDFDQDNLCNVNDINLMFMQGDLVADPGGTLPFQLSGDTSIDG